MVVVHLMGGLGNQMFQYAAAKALSIHRNITFKVDFDDPYKYVKRNYSLDFFNFNVEFATKRELAACKPKVRFERRWWLLTGRNPNNKLFAEKADYVFDPSFFSIEDGAYISGFWQTEKYFLSIRDVLLRDFQIRYKPSSPNLQLLEQAAGVNAISLHIRRGDYVTVSKTNGLHGTCGMDYYKRAIDYISLKTENPVFFVFSDDMDWVKSNLESEYPLIFIDINDEKTSYEDLRIMSACKHHIIANSSFSWWGAWLNDKKNKMVICPERWTNKHNTATIDLIPADWIKL